MSTIEERLERDIAALAGGVVVTESDLKDAHDAVEERLEFGRQQSRRRTVAMVVAAAVAIPIVGVALVRAVDKDESAPPVAPVLPVTPVETVSAQPGGWLIGRPPTRDLIQGVWREDDGGVQLRFTAPDGFAADNVGRLFHDPGLVGTWDLKGDEITITLTGGTDGCAGEKFAMRASLADQGTLRFAPTYRSVGRCAPFHAWGALQQVLPTSPDMAAFILPKKPAGKPWPDRRSLYGLWQAEGGGYAMELGRDGSYVVADNSGEPVDRGRFSLRDAELTLTSSARSVRCSTGDRLVWSDLRLVDPGTLGLRGATVLENSCGASWADKNWILVPDHRTS
jgi:hypothetical protein